MDIDNIIDSVDQSYLDKLIGLKLYMGNGSGQPSDRCCSVVNELLSAMIDQESRRIAAEVKRLNAK